MADPKGEGVKVGFDGSLRLEFHGAKVTSDAGLLAYRDLDEALGTARLDSDQSKVALSCRNFRISRAMLSKFGS